jgi:hypothetical protein
MGQLPKLRRCYEVEFGTGRGAAEGSVTFSWKIAPSGAVSDVTAMGSSPGVSATVKCAVDEIKKWKFPRSASSNNVSWPFHWGTSSPDGGG